MGSGTKTQDVNRGYRDLDAWQAAMDVSDAIYDLVDMLPSSERFELSSQIRRAGTSIPSNIAEGYGMGMSNAYLYHLRRARGSSYEVETQLEIIRRRELAPKTLCDAVQDKLDRSLPCLAGLIRWVEGELDRS